jgi:cell division protein FtsB
MKGMASRQERWVLLAAVVLFLVIIGAVAWGFWRQIHRWSELRAIEKELAPLVAYEQQRNEELQQTLDAVSSPDYPEEWARTHAGMVRPGEVRLVLPAQEETVEPSSSGSTSEAPSFWEALWQQLFGDE